MSKQVRQKQAMAEVFRTQSDCYSQSQYGMMCQGYLVFEPQQVGSGWEHGQSGVIA